MARHLNYRMSAPALAQLQAAIARASKAGVSKSKMSEARKVLMRVMMEKRKADAASKRALSAVELESAAAEDAVKNASSATAVAAAKAATSALSSLRIGQEMLHDSMEVSEAHSATPAAISAEPPATVKRESYLEAVRFQKGENLMERLFSKISKVHAEADKVRQDTLSVPSADVRPERSHSSAASTEKEKSPTKLAHASPTPS